MNTDAAPAASSWLGFEVAGERYAVPLADVREVIRPEVPTPVPGAPAEVLGIINLRGNIVTILDGRRRLGLTETAGGRGPEQRVVIFHDEREPIGMRIDALQDVLDIDPRNLLPHPLGLAAGPDDPVLGLVARDDGCITLLDTGKLCRVREPAMETST